MFGRRSEKGNATSEQSKPSTGRKRGGQLGHSNGQRREQPSLPEEKEIHDLSTEEKHCSSCNHPFKALPKQETSKIIEIHVKAHIRIIHRPIYARCCDCEETPSIITAPPAGRVYPRATLGVSVWCYLLIGKYHEQRSTNELLMALSEQGVSIAPSTISEAHKKLLPLMVPVYDAMVEKSLSSEHWHADETGWKVFERIEGKANHRWYLWLFKTEETIVHKLAPSRSSSVLIEHFGEGHDGGILNVDRYGAYKAIAKQGLFVLAYCWAHVRRDFLSHAKGYPEQEEWALLWVNLIAELYHINNQRIVYKKTSKVYRFHQKQLSKKLDNMRALLDEQLSSSQLLPSAKKLMTSLDNHWEGLTVFGSDPDIPMDNNPAERGLRSSVLGRNRYYGSGSVVSAKFTCAMFSIFKTLKLWSINLNTWLSNYLNACAQCENKIIPDINQFLPWLMSEDRLFYFQQPLS